MKTSNPNQNHHGREVQPFDESLCEHLPRRLKAICLGTAEGVSPDDVERYRTVFAARTFNAESRATVQKSRGLGDTVKKIFDAIGISAIAARIYGKGCGCEERREMLNKLVPYQ